MADPAHFTAERPGSEIRRRGSSTSVLSALSPIPSNRVTSTNTGIGRSRSSTTSVLFNYINDAPQEKVRQRKPRQKLVSLYRLLLLELNLPGDESTKIITPENTGAIQKSQDQLTNMMKVPYYLEKFIFFGLLVCSNAFLTLFTLVPLKIAIVSCSALKDYFTSPQHDSAVLRKRLHFVKRDLITMLLIISSVALLSTPLLEVSRLYHDIRGQAHIKLYVMFGVLEVTDKLLSSIAQEVFTVLVGLPWTNLTPKKVGKLAFFSLAALAFFACHSYALIYQSVALHVAANSYSNALLALLLSNQFSELKSAVFKKFEREGLFQVSMSDLTERFQLSIMLFVIALRNLSQVSSTHLGLIPDSWKSWNKWFGAIFGPSVVVLGSEIFVDWIKHCYINKFNLIRPRIYENFLYVLSSDFKEVFTLNSKADTSNEVSDYIILTKRIGLPIISLTICFLRMALKDLRLFFMPSSLQISSVLSSIILVILAFVVLLVARLLLSLWLLKWARYIKHAHDAHQESIRQMNKNYSSSLSSDSELKPELEPCDIDDFTMNKTKRPMPEGDDDSGSEAHAGLMSHVPPYLRRVGTPSPMVESTRENYYDESQFASPTDSEIDSSFLPGIPNTESSSINPKTRSFLYDYGENVPPTLEEKRNSQLLKRKSLSSKTTQKGCTDALHDVHRYEMSSKKIW